VAGGAAGGGRGAGRPGAGGDPRGPRPAPAGRHRPQDRDRDLRAGGRRRGRPRGPAAAGPARLRPAPHGLPRADHDCLGHLHPLLRRRRPLAGPPRLPADAVPERPRLQPGPGGGGRPAGDGRAARRAGGGRLLPHQPRDRRRHRAAPRLHQGRHGPRLRAGDLDLPGDRPRRGRHGHGGRRARLPRGRARLARLVGRVAEADAVVVGVQPQRRAGRRQQGDRGQGPGAAGGGRPAATG
jgi:hypothetical protein